jgi:predicted MPP superfamily phosphohydrolase
VQALTRRRFFQRAAIAGSAIAMAAGADSIVIEPKNVMAERINIALARLPEEFHGFRIAQISDIHYGPYMGEAGVERAIRLAESFKPDLLILTGDFVSHPFGKSNGPEGARYAEPCADALVKMKNVPKIAVLGNHDHWNDPVIVEGALHARAIEVLRNRSVAVVRGQSRIWIAGVDDVIAGAANMQQTLQSIPSGEAVILLAHEPDFADYASRFPVDIQFSGHSHGGQVRLPGIGAPILPVLGQKYPVGLNTVGRLQVYTNRGLGVINPPVRFLCPPEVTFVTLLHPSAV